MRKGPPDSARPRESRAPGRFPCMIILETQAKVFCVRRPEIDENRAFSANDHCISPDPDFTSLPNLHHQIARNGADHVFQICQVFAGCANGVVDRESWIMIVFDLDEA